MKPRTFWLTLFAAVVFAALSLLAMLAAFPLPEVPR